MTVRRTSFSSIDAYIAAAPPGTREILASLHHLVHEAAPGAEEAIRYGIPTFLLGGTLVHFAAFRHHIGFYPTPSAIEAFRDEIAPYPHARGSVRFPLDRPIPYDLVRRMVRFRVEENTAKRPGHQG